MTLQDLLDGNTRFAISGATHPRQDGGRRLEVALTARPGAVVLGCADARVPPEIVFDQGLGDLFVIRVAGALADDAALASIELAVAEMGVPLVVVLGHTRCRAIETAVKAVTGGAQPGGRIGRLVELARPAVEQAGGRPGDLLDGAVRAAVELTVAQLRACEPLIAPAVRDGRVTIAGVRYDVDSGIITVIA